MQEVDGKHKQAARAQQAAEATHDAKIGKLRQAMRQAELQHQVCQLHAFLGNWCGLGGVSTLSWAGCCLRIAWLMCAMLPFAVTRSQHVCGRQLQEGLDDHSTHPACLCLQ